MTKIRNVADKTGRSPREREEFRRREYYKLEFIKRNKRKWEEFREQRCRFPRENPNEDELRSINEIYNDFVKYFPATFFPSLSNPDSEIPDWQISTLAIEILSPTGKGSYWFDDSYDYLHYENDSPFLDSAMKKRQSEHRKSPILAVDAVDEENKTIGVIIHLDRNKDDIRKDLSYLLDLLDTEAGLSGMELQKKRKRPTKDSDSIYEKYDLYLKVLDLKDQGKSWPDIAREVFPDEFKDPDMLKETDPDQNPENAIKKVMHYHDEAEQIKAGIWRKI